MLAAGVLERLVPFGLVDDCTPTELKWSDLLLWFIQICVRKLRSSGACPDDAGLCSAWYVSPDPAISIQMVKPPLHVQTVD